MKFSTLILIFLTVNNLAFADYASYSDSLRLKIETKNYIIVHFHNWTQETKEQRYKMISSNQDPFNIENNYAYIECIDKRTGKSLFKRPSSALTKIQASEDEKFIVCLSNIKIDNPFQFLIYTINGDLIEKRHISSQEAKFSKQELNSFMQNYPSQYEQLRALNRIRKLKNYIYIDFNSLSMPKKLGLAWNQLYQHIAGNHLSDNFSETITNWVYWFYEAGPNIKFIYKKKKLYCIELLDTKMGTMKINVSQNLQ